MGLDRNFTIVLKRYSRPEGVLGILNNLVMLIFNLSICPEKLLDDELILVSNVLKCRRCRHFQRRLRWS